MSVYRFPVSAIHWGAALCVVASTLAAAEIRDDAKLFSPDVVTAQKARLNDIERAAHHGVTIETHAGLPADRAKDVEAMSSRQRAEFYSDWLKQRAKASRAEGIFVLVTKEPGHVEVGVSGKLQSAGYSAASKKALVDTLLTSFREKAFDAGLTKAVSQIEKDYAHLRGTVSRTASRETAQAPRVLPAPRQAPAQGISWLGIGLIIGAVVIGLMLLSSIMRAFSGGPGQYGPAGVGYGGGGGFGSGLLGGLLGGMAGSWLYDSFSGHSNSAHAGETGHSDTFGGGTSSAGDDTWSTSGGDFGSGSDFGGGDFSGGSDFGGGDFGGGGDF